LKRNNDKQKNCRSRFNPFLLTLIRGFQYALCSIAILFAPSNSFAVDAPSSGGDAAYKVLLIEAMIIGASYAAAEKPRAFGASTALLIPYAAAMDNQSSVSTRWIGTIIAEGIAFYNYRVESQDEPVERDEIVRKNIIGWNIFAVTVALSEKLTNVKTGQAGFSYYLQPSTQGQTLQVSYRF